MHDLYEEAIKKASPLAKADLDANGHYANAPYTVRVKGTMLKARIVIDRRDGEKVIKLQIYVPETYIGSQELSREEDRGPEPKPIV